MDPCYNLFGLNEDTKATRSKQPVTRRLSTALNEFNKVTKNKTYTDGRKSKNQHEFTHREFPYSFHRCSSQVAKTKSVTAIVTKSEYAF